MKRTFRPLAGNEGPMRTPLPLRVALTALCAALLAGCPPSGGTTPRTGPLTARDLYPFGDGYVWTYDIDTETETGTSLGVVRVTAMTGNVVQITDTMGTTHDYELREGGIWRPEGAVWLLHDPIELGAQWPSLNGRTARITSVTASADTFAGHYDGCVEVSEEGGDTERTIRTTYCPDVGPVVIELHQVLTTSTSGGVNVVGRLRDFSNGLDDWTSE